MERQPRTSRLGSDDGRLKNLRKVKKVNNMENTRFEELEKILENECEKHENDCSKCPHKKECEEYGKLYESQNK